MATRQRRRPVEHARERDDDVVLTNTERWVIRELLSVARIDERPHGKYKYFIHKCEKNGLNIRAAKALADVFDIDVPDELWDRYSPAQ
jgi:hypothetical protein